MKKQFVTLCAVAVLVLLNPAPGNASDPLTIVTIGDSTVANYALTDVKRGWGQVLNDYLAPAIKVTNLAKSGRSTKTFFDTGNWKTALDAKPNFIFIQFGHNDSHPKDKPESTDANTDFQENLRRYVSEARAVGARSVLVTPMHRLTFAKSTRKLTHELKPYADAMKQVAAQTKTPLIDLYTLSGEVFEPLGDSGVAGMTASNQDRTHFTEKGARIIARIVAAEAGKIDPRLRSQGETPHP